MSLPVRRSPRPLSSYWPRRVAQIIPPLLLLALLLVAWQVWAVATHVPDYLVPAPSSIWSATVQERDLLATNTWPTVQIAVYGFSLAVITGFVLAVAIHYARWLEIALYPILIASQSVPLIALAPILVVALGYGLLPKLIIVCLICFFPIVVNTVDGLKRTDPEMRELLRSFGAGRLRVFREVELPGALPYFFSGAKVAGTYSVVGALVGEWVGSWQGLGYLMTQKMSELDTAVIFSAMAILTAMGLAFFGIIALAARLTMPWYAAEQRRTADRRER